MCATIALKESVFLLRHRNVLQAMWAPCEKRIALWTPAIVMTHVIDNPRCVETTFDTTIDWHNMCQNMGFSDVLRLASYGRLPKRRLHHY